MDDRLKLLSDIGLNISDGKEYTGGDEKYLAAVQRYYSNFEKMRSVVEESFAVGDMGEYMIKVHSLKSNSKMIGAEVLATEFEKLEFAAKEGDRDYVNANTRNVLLMYSNLIEKLKPVSQMEEVRIPGEIDAESAKLIAEELIEALDDFDDERAKELVEKLYGYPFRIRQKDILDKALGYINDFLYDEATELVREILPEIE